MELSDGENVSVRTFSCWDQSYVIGRYFASLLRSFYNLTDQFHEGWAKQSMHVYKTQLENYFLKLFPYHLYTSEE